MADSTLIAIDIGNSRTKWARFVGDQMVSTRSLALGDLAAAATLRTEWAEPDARWAVASVNPDGSEPLVAWLREQGGTPLILNDPALLPLVVELDRPEAVGIDRLLDAVAVNARRPRDRPAIIVDAGSAITVDAVSARGSFLGGAIAPGIGLAARALHEFTYWLPLLEVTAAAAVLGRSTPDAMRSGLFWGSVGAVRELVDRLAALFDIEPVVFVTGGDGSLIAPMLGRRVELSPDLTLRGIWAATQHVLRPN
jgi:type III pantothenate kinase